MTRYLNDYNERVSLDLRKAFYNVSWVWKRVQFVFQWRLERLSKQKNFCDCPKPLARHGLPRLPRPMHPLEALLPGEQIRQPESFS